jgi:hypothetical protein
MSLDYVSGSTLLDRISPILRTWKHEEFRGGFEVQKVDPFGIQLISDEGYEYVVNADNMNVDFKHRLRAKPVSGGLPTLDLMSDAKPFTELLSECTRRLAALAAAMCPSGQRKIERIGLVSTTVVDEADAPPGVQRLISYLGAPWGKEPMAFYNCQLVGMIKSEKNGYDRCIHHVSRNADQELTTIRLDWQRQYDEGQPLDRLDRLLELSELAALEYFEEIAMGDRFDNLHTGS